MSMLLMVKAMNTKVGNSSRKLVLIKLADHANDTGVCWPSHDHIAEQCEMSKRTVIRHIEELEKQGLIKVVQRKREGEAFNKTNLYFLNLNDDAILSPSTENDSDNLSNDSDILSNDSDNLSNTIVTQCHPNQSLRTSHKTEPVIEPNNIIGDFDFSKLVQPIEKTIILDFIKYRKSIKKPLTQSAVNHLVREINKAITAGHDPNEIMEMTLSRGWQSFSFSYLSNQAQQSSRVNKISTGTSNPTGFKVVNA